jgi:organic radical activating enzyme
MLYTVAERFKSVQGEGVWTGTPMAFIRFAGCSVGKKTCHACDTDFERVLPWRGGGEYDSLELLEWARPFKHVCLTGGEPLDRDLGWLFEEAGADIRFHIETSGTILFDRYPGTWLCVSPKPGYLDAMLERADELKIIVPGLGTGDGWPTLQYALRWADRFPEKPIFLQPKNARHAVDRQNLAQVLELLQEHPNLRLSVQLHKLLEVR